jgi:hypothetical protein
VRGSPPRSARTSHAAIGTCVRSSARRTWPGVASSTSSPAT